MQQKYITNSPAIASYNWVDMNAGTGLEDYYCMQQTNTGGTTYHLITQAYAGQGTAASYGRTIGASTCNFDTTVFNLPRSIRGTAYLSCEVNGDSTATVTISAKLQKVSKGVASDISSTITKTISVSTSVVKSGVFLAIPITSKTYLAINDYIRLVFTCSTDNGTIKIGVDPLSANDMIPLKISIPYAVEVNTP